MVPITIPIKPMNSIRSNFSCPSPEYTRKNAHIRIILAISIVHLWAEDPYFVVKTPLT